MALSDKRWQIVTRSAFEWERNALNFIRERLPDEDPYLAWSNFDFLADDGRTYEVDLLIVVPRGLFLIEVKSTPGTLEGDAYNWTWTTPEKRPSHPRKPAPPRESKGEGAGLNTSSPKGFDQIFCPLHHCYCVLFRQWPQTQPERQRRS
jgi:Nuclease-related domain